MKRSRSAAMLLGFLAVTAILLWSATLTERASFRIDLGAKSTESKNLVRDGAMKLSKTDDVSSASKSKSEFYIRINDKVQPLERGEIYEDPILASFSGESPSIVNSGTMQAKSGEIEFSDIDLQVELGKESSALFVNKLKEFLERQGIPAGSYIEDRKDGKRTPIGRKEGIAIYLNGTDLPEAVYEKSDINVVVAELQKRLGLNDQPLRYWQGPTETALYFYGNSFAEMKSKIQDFLNEYPLCEKCRVVKVA